MRTVYCSNLKKMVEEEKLYVPKEEENVLSKQGSPHGLSSVGRIKQK